MKWLCMLLVLTPFGMAHAQFSSPTQQQTQTIVTSAQLLALNTTPVTLVPAPPQGAGYAIVVDMVVYSYTHVTTDYATNSDGGIFYGTPAGQTNSAGSDDRTITTAVVNVGNSMILVAPAYRGGSSFAPVLVQRAVAENQPIMYGAPSSGIYSPYLTGDGTMTVTVIYHIIAF
jgi:hypothetical protein